MTRGEAKATMSALVLAPILALATMQAATAQPRPAEFQRLGDADIRARILGRDITDDFHWTEYYRANGVLDIDGMGRRRAGRWKIERGLLYIQRPEIAAGFECFQVWVWGDEVSLRTGTGSDGPTAFIRRHRSG